MMPILVTHGMVRETTPVQLLSSPTAIVPAQASVDVSLEKIPSNQTNRFAYAFIVGGIDPNRGGYRGFLYNILVATYILRREGSKADVVARFQMSAEYEGDRLPSHEERELEKMGIKFEYIPKPDSGKGTFYDLTMQKFIILEMTEYSRVLFLDADVLPVANLDYVFEMSVGPDAVLKENLIIANSKDPSNAGFFMLEPLPGEYHQLQNIIRTRYEKAKDLPHPKFDKVDGWGHRIEPPDMWKSGFNKGTLWDFWCANSDQGLLYHWTKYVKKSVSQVVKRDIYNWSWDNNGTMGGGGPTYTGLKTVSLPFPRECSPHCDFHHYTGSHRKPWRKFKSLPDDFASSDYDNSTSYTKWFIVLELVNKQIDMGLNLSDWGSIQRKIQHAALGEKPQNKDIVANVEKHNNKKE